MPHEAARQERKEARRRTRDFRRAMKRVRRGEVPASILVRHRDLLGDRLRAEARAATDFVRRRRTGSSFLTRPELGALDAQKRRLKTLVRFSKEAGVDEELVSDAKGAIRELEEEL